MRCPEGVDKSQRREVYKPQVMTVISSYDSRKRKATRYSAARTEFATPQVRVPAVLNVTASDSVRIAGIFLFDFFQIYVIIIIVKG